MKLNLSASLEDYLEAILELKMEKNKVRVTDLSNALGVKKSSVNTAIGKLKKLNLVYHERYEDIKLTWLGLEAAKKVKTKHDILFRFLSEFLGVDIGIADEDACKIEHIISDETFGRVENFMNFIEKKALYDKSKWLKDFKAFIKDGQEVV